MNKLLVPLVKVLGFEELLNIGISSLKIVLLDFVSNVILDSDLIDA